MVTIKPDDIRIRAATLADAEPMTALCMRSKASNGYDDAFMAACADELFIGEEEMEERLYYVAELGDVLAGCGAVSLVGTVAEIESMFVSPDLKRAGIGSRLWDALEAKARALGASRLILDADPHAVEFYKSRGMEIVGENASNSIEGRMLPHMAKLL